MIDDKLERFKGAFWKDLKRDMASGQKVRFVSEDDGCKVVYLLEKGKYSIFIDKLKVWESSNEMKAKSKMINTIGIYRLVRL